MSTRVFICYRRSDSRFLAHLVAEFLGERLGSPNVFVDVESVAAGEAIWPRIQRELEHAHLVIALIGPNWQPERLHAADDWVRRELMLAIKKNIPIIPAFHSDIEPRKILENLPSSLSVLRKISHLIIPDPPRHRDALEKDLSVAVERHLGTPIPERRLPLTGLAVGLSTSEPDTLPPGVDIELVRYSIVAVAERLLVEGASIVFGGLMPIDDPSGRWNVTKRLDDLARTFPNRILNYALPPPVRAPGRRTAITIQEHSVQHDPRLTGSSERAKSSFALTDLRRALAELTDARVCLGGASTGYGGKMPGVVEEVQASLAAGRPTLLLGGYGGVTKEMAELVAGRPSDVLTGEFQMNANSGYSDLVAELDELGPDFAVDYDSLASTLARGPIALHQHRFGTPVAALLSETRWRVVGDLLVEVLHDVASTK